MGHQALQEHVLAAKETDVIDLLDSEDEARDVIDSWTRPPAKRSRLTSKSPPKARPDSPSHTAGCEVTTVHNGEGLLNELLKTPIATPTLFDRLQNILQDIDQGTAEGVPVPCSTAPKPSAVPINICQDRIVWSFPSQGVDPAVSHCGMSRNASAPVPHQSIAEAHTQELSRNSSAPLVQTANRTLPPRAVEGSAWPPLACRPNQMDKNGIARGGIGCSNLGLRPSGSGPSRTSGSGASQPSMGQWASSQRSQSLQPDTCETDDAGDGSCFSNIWRLPGLGGDWGIEEMDIRIPPLPPGRSFEDEFDVCYAVLQLACCHSCQAFLTISSGPL